MTITDDTTPGAEPITLTVRRTNVPARNLPAGLWIDVLAVLKAHGLEPSPTEITSALARVVRHTPVDQGGRLLPSGRVDNDDMPNIEPSWFCAKCWQDLYSTDAKERHDSYCDALT